MEPERTALPLIGRATELSTLLGMVEGVRSGAPAVALVEGEPGIGKTTLLEEALRLASGFTLFAAHCEEVLHDRPFGPLADALQIDPRSHDPEHSELAALLLEADERGPASPGPELRVRIMEEILALLERAASAGPILLALEDLHWADDSTLLTIERINRGLLGLPLLIIATLRPAPRAPALRRIAAGFFRSVTHVHLGALNEEAVSALITEVAGAPPGPRLQETVHAARGNPLFVLEIVAALREEEGVSIVDGRAEVGRVMLPLSFRTTIVRQISALPTQTVALIRIASVLGPSLRSTHLAAVLGRKVSDLLPGLDAAVHTGVLIQQPEGFTFRHELVREVVYLDIPQDVRRGLHLQAARALAFIEAPPDEIAYHYSLGADRGDRVAASWIIAAAKRAAALSPETATELYKRALEIILDPDNRVVVLAEMAETLLWAGRIEEAAQVAEEALAGTRDPGLSMQLRRSLARTCLMQGRAADALSHVQAAEEEDIADDDQRWRLESESSLARLFCGDLPGAIAKAEALNVAAERSDDDWLRCEALVVLGLAAYFQGRVAEAGDLLGRAMAPAARRPDGFRYGPHLFLGTALIDADRLEDADKVLAEGQRLSERMGIAWQYTFYFTQLGLQRFVAGRWDEAKNEFEDGLAEMWGTTGFGVFPSALLATMAIHRGDEGAAKSHLESAREAASSGTGFGIDALMWAESLILATTSDPTGARAVLENAWQLNLMLGFTSQCVRLGPDLARLAIATDDADLAAAVARVMDDAAALNPVSSWRGASLLCRGLAEDDPEIIAKAVTAYQDSPRPVEKAFACLDAGSVLARHKIDGAAAMVQQALAVIEPLGLKPHVARADSMLRSLGIRRGRRGRRRRPTSGWDSLTETELAVTRLAAEGLTNPEIGERLFISRRTVESHLSRVFGKLGLTSRVQLAAEAARRSD